MLLNITNKNLAATVASLAAFLFAFLFGACTDEHFITAPVGSDDEAIIGDTTVSLSGLNFNHAEWSSSNGLAKADHYFDGYVKYMVGEKLVKMTKISHENAPMSIKWEPIAENSGEGISKYLGCEAGDTVFVESHKNQEVTFAKYERESTLSFEGFDVTLKASWYQASLGSAEKYCRYDSTTVTGQHADFEMIDGEKVVVEKDGQKYNRLVVTAEAENHFTDMPEKKQHSEEMPLQYNVLVPVGTEPELEDEFLGFDKEIIKGDNNNDSKIIIVEHWSISGDKEIVYTQSANYSFAVSGQQRVFGETLNFVSGPTKSTNSGNFTEVKENQFVRTISDTYTAKFNLCEVKAIAGYNEAYVEYRNEKINFEFAKAEVSYEGINNPTATEVEADGKLFSRKAYEVTFAHSVLGEKVASVLVDKETEPEDPTTPDEWGKLDIAKTKAFGGLAWSWRPKASNPKEAEPFVTGTIITEYGVISFWEGGSCFNRMDTNLITERLGNALKAEGPEYLIPTYIKILTDPNKHWGYQDVNGQYRAEIYGTQIELLPNVSLDKPFIAEGGDASVYTFSENGNVVRVAVTFNGEEIFSEVFAK